MIYHIISIYYISFNEIIPIKSDMKDKEQKRS